MDAQPRTSPTSLIERQHEPRRAPAIWTVDNCVSAVCALGYVPTLLAAATCVYIGVDFLWDNLVSVVLERGVGAAAATYAVFAICLRAGMLWGVLACATAYQLYDRAFGAPEKVKST